jgi:hypothetical protein
MQTDEDLAAGAFVIAIGITIGCVVITLSVAAYGLWRVCAMLWEAL